MVVIQLHIQVCLFACVCVCVCVYVHFNMSYETGLDIKNCQGQVNPAVGQPSTWVEKSVFVSFPG